MLVARFPPTEVASRVAVSLGVGLLVGIEREWSNKDLGARTFALTALLGTGAALFGGSAVAVAFIGIFLIVIFANLRSLMVDRSLETTTSAALLVIFILGALAGQGHLFTPVAAAILMMMLLAWKNELHRFAGGLQPTEIRSAVLLGLLALVVYPVLPNRFVDPWSLVNPRQDWVLVIAIAGIGFLNYVLLKAYGAKGMFLSGFLAGFVNSSAAAVELTKPLATDGASSDLGVAALLLAILAMFARNLIILAIFAPSAVPTAMGPLLAMAIVALIFILRVKPGAEETPREIHLESPVLLKRVLGFAALFLLIQIIATLGERYLGKAAFLGISLLGGFASSASTSAAAANMVVHTQLTPKLAGEGVVLASIASALVNLPIVHRATKNPVLTKRLATLTIPLLLIGIVVLALQEYHWIF
ncbi:MAG: MgtC/SapB family protein [Candidatus Acidiferrales bacterium]